MSAVRKSLSPRKPQNTQNNSLLEFRGFRVFCGGKLAVPLIAAFVVFGIFVINRQIVLAQVHPDRATLRRDLEAVTSAPILSRSHWSILIKSLDKGDIIYEQNARKLVMPASNMKVFTIAGAAAKLGWNYRYQTSLESDAPLVNGILMGDLVVRGSGDPSIGTRDGLDVKAFDDWAAQLRAAGIRAIDGRVVGDDNLFDETEIGNGWSWDDLGYGYAAPVGALTYNDSLVTASARPGRTVGSPALVDVAPAHHGFTIVSHATTSEASQPETLEVSRERGSLVLTITGTVPFGSERVATATAAVDNPTLFFVRSLRAALRARGIPVAGDAVDIDLLAPDDPARLPHSRRPLATHASPPLTDLGRTFLKVSQNLYGELLVKTLGAVAGEGTTARGQLAIREALESWGVPRDSYILADGSGLSRLNYVSAEAEVTILEHMFGDPQHRAALLNALPVGGKDGTLRNRLKAAWTQGQVHAKTGSIANTRALSGFVTTRSGETLVFSIIANNFSLPAWRVERVIDLMVEIVAR